MLVDFLLMLDDSEKALLMNLEIIKEKVVDLVDACPRLEADFLSMINIVNVLHGDTIEGHQDCIQHASEAALSLRGCDITPFENISSLLCRLIYTISTAGLIWRELQRKWDVYLQTKTLTSAVTTYKANEQSSIILQIEVVNKCIDDYKFLYGRRDSNEITVANLTLTSLLMELNDGGAADTTKVCEGLEPLREKAIKSKQSKLNDTILKLYELLNVSDRTIQIEIEMKNELAKFEIDDLCSAAKNLCDEYTISKTETDESLSDTDTCLQNILTTLDSIIKENDMAYQNSIIGEKDRDDVEFYAGRIRDRINEFKTEHDASYIGAVVKQIRIIFINKQDAVPSLSNLHQYTCQLCESLGMVEKEDRVEQMAQEMREVLEMLETGNS